MQAFDVLGEPVRRRILELLADGELTSGAVCEVIQEEYKISQPGVSSILGAAKLSGRVGAWSVGALDAWTGADKARIA